MAKLRDQITDSSQVVYRPLEAVFVPAPWYRGRVVLIGDAVHATTPHLGQGAAQAVEDAVVLGRSSQGRAARTVARDVHAATLRALRFIRRLLQIGEWEQRPTPDADPAALTKKMLEVVARPI